jgi:purine-binding chemotaxis protein CheW
MGVAQLRLEQDLSTLQPDAFAALKQLVAQSPSAAAALQTQLAQAKGQLRKDGVPTAQMPAAAGGEQYLVFSLADYELAVKAELVQGVERLGEITSVPNVVPWVRGVINLRGSIVSVVDLRMFLGLEGVSYTLRTRLLSLQCKEMVICLIVDGVSEMLPIPASVIINGDMRQAIPIWAASYAGGSALLANRLMVILDVPRLLFSEKMHQYAL